MISELARVDKGKEFMVGAGVRGLTGVWVEHRAGDILSQVIMKNCHQTVGGGPLTQVSSRA